MRENRYSREAFPNYGVERKRSPPQVPCGPPPPPTIISAPPAAPPPPPPLVVQKESPMDLLVAHKGEINNYGI